MEYTIIRYRLIKEVPLLRKGFFDFEIETGNVFMVDEKGNTAEYSLRAGLAGYLWLLRTEKGYFRKVKGE